MNAPSYCCNVCFEASATQGDRVFMRRMILCPDCGNKRCPKATDHKLACTHSNEPGQPGSRYQSSAPIPETDLIGWDANGSPQR